MRKRTMVITGILVVIVGGAAARGMMGGGDSNVTIRAETVGRRDLVSTVTASGKIAPKTAVDIASDITGRIVRIGVEEGQLVNRGDLLLQIDPTTFEAGVARMQAALSSARAGALQAQVNRDQAKRTLDRSLDLRATDANLVSDEALETAQQNFDVASAVHESQVHQVAQAEASLRESEDQLSKTVIRSPMSGRVTRLAVEEGEVALASTFDRATGLLMTISDLSVIQLNVLVDETDVIRLQLGDSATISIDAFPDTTFVGQVTAVAQSSTQASAAAASADQAVDYDVEITLWNPPVDVRPDLSGTAVVVTETRMEALSIPIISLTMREHAAMPTEVGAAADTTKKDTEGVFVIRSGRAEFRPVVVGIAGEEHFEVLRGLTEGDSIVAGPYQAIRDLQDSTIVVVQGTTPRSTARPGAGS